MLHMPISTLCVQDLGLVLGPRLRTFGGGGGGGFKVEGNLVPSTFLQVRCIRYSVRAYMTYRITCLLST